MSNHEIIRVERAAGNFAVMHKGFLADDRLSFKAKGVLAYCLSKHDSWKVVVANLVNQSTDGKAAVLTALRELRLYGYYEKNPVRDACGKILQWEGVIREVPADSSFDNPVDSPVDNHVDNTVDNSVDNLQGDETSILQEQHPENQNLAETRTESPTHPDTDFQDVANQVVGNQVVDYQDVGNQDIENRVRNNNDFSNNDLSNNDSKPHKARYAECVFLTEHEYNSLLESLGAAGAAWCIQKLDAYKRQTGRQYKSDYAAMENWVIARYQEHIAKAEQSRNLAQNKASPPSRQAGRGRSVFNNLATRKRDYAELARLEVEYQERVLRGSG